MHLSPLLAASLMIVLPASAQTPDPAREAAEAVNVVGLELFRETGVGSANGCLSPYSIQTALVMAYAGAEGGTRTQMREVLHYPESGAVPAFAALQEQINLLTSRSEKLAKRMQSEGGEAEPIVLNIANRLFGQTGYDFKPAFLETLKTQLHAPFQPMDFVAAPERCREEINTWVAEKTREKIRDLLPKNSITEDTGLVLVNALYLKAPWAERFNEGSTRPANFHLSADQSIEVPTMHDQGDYGYRKFEGFTAVSIPYLGGELQFLILLPDEVHGLPAIEAGITADLLRECAALSNEELVLSLPKFRLEPPLYALGGVLKSLGMTEAFDIPQGSANFAGIAPRKPDDYLAISEVFHKTFVEIDEKGTEAAAATAVVMIRATAAMPEPTEPKVVKVDRPFFFAIQHRPTAACLFLGHMVDPR